MNILHRLCRAAAMALAGSALGQLLSKVLIRYVPEALKVFLLLGILPQCVQLCSAMITLPAFALGIFSTVYINECRISCKATSLYISAYTFALGLAALSGMIDIVFWQFVPTGALQGRKIWLLSVLTFIIGGLIAVWMALSPRLIGMILALTSGMVFQSVTEKNIGIGTVVGLILTVL